MEYFEKQISLLSQFCWCSFHSENFSAPFCFCICKAICMRRGSCFPGRMRCFWWSHKHLWHWFTHPEPSGRVDFQAEGFWYDEPWLSGLACFELLFRLCYIFHRSAPSHRQTLFSNKEIIISAAANRMPTKMLCGWVIFVLQKCCPASHPTRFNRPRLFSWDNSSLAVSLNKLQ